MLDIDFSNLCKDIKQSGFHLLDMPQGASVESLGMLLGQPVPSVPGRPIVDTLVPKTPRLSRPGSLSARFGMGSFPFHTETAHWRFPIDWAILHCVDPGSGHRPTLLVDGWELDLTDHELDHLSKSLMIVKNGSRSFLAPPVEKGIHGPLFRCDFSCMCPAFRSAAWVIDVLREKLREATPRIVHWKTGLCLILDNRRMLHSRGASLTFDPDRRIERVYVVKQ